MGMGSDQKTYATKQTKTASEMELGRRHCEKDRWTLDQNYNELETTNDNQWLDHQEGANVGTEMAAVTNGLSRMEEQTKWRNTSIRGYRVH